MMAKLADGSHKSPEEHAHPKEGTVGYFFFEFWPIMMFVGLFLMMCALPMFLSPDFSAVLSPWAAFILLSFVGSLAVLFLATRWIGMYLAVVSVAAFIVTFITYPESIKIFAIYWIAILFVLYVLVGMIFFPQEMARKKRQEK